MLLKHIEYYRLDFVLNPPYSSMQTEEKYVRNFLFLETELSIVALQ